MITNVLIEEPNDTMITFHAKFHLEKSLVGRCLKKFGTRLWVGL